MPNPALRLKTPAYDVYEEKSFGVKDAVKEPDNAAEDVNKMTWRYFDEVRRFLCLNWRSNYY